MSSKPIVFVTGATGSVGSSIIHQLSTLDDVEVRAGVHSFKSESALKLKSYPNVSLVKFTEDANIVKEAFKGVDRVVMIFPSIVDYERVTKLWLTTAKESGVKNVVHLSGLGISEHSENGPLIIGRYQWANQQFVESSFPQWTIVQPNFFLDNIIKFYGPSIKNSSKWSNSANNGKTSFVDVRDVAAVCVESVRFPDRHHGKKYPVTGSESLSDSEQADMLCKELGRTITYTPISPEEEEKQLISHGMPPILAKDYVVLNNFRAAGYCCEPHGTVKDVTGKNPITFSQWLTENATLLKE